MKIQSNRESFGAIYERGNERYVTVHNVDPRKRELTNCLATIVTYMDNQGEQTPFPDKALRTMYQDPKRSGPSNLRPGQPKRILIASLVKTGNARKLELGYVDPERFCPYVDPNRRFQITIAVYADEGERVVRNYELFVDEHDKAVLRESTTR